MTTTNRRKAPERDALEHVANAIDKTAHLEVKFMNSVKGRGVFAKSHFEKGNFVVEYRGQLIQSDEAQRRRRVYHSACAVFMFDFHWQEKLWCIDAAQEYGSFGRLVNDEHIHPNCKMKKVVVDGKPHLCLFAMRDIIPGQEITYNYGGTDWPWRKKTKKQQVGTKFAAVEATVTSQQPAVETSVFKNKIRRKLLLTESSTGEVPETSQQPAEVLSVFKKKTEEQEIGTKFTAVEATVTSQQPAVETSVLKNKIGKNPLVTMSTAIEAPETSQRPAVVLSVFKKKIGDERLVNESAVADSSETSEHCDLLSPPSKKRINRQTDFDSHEVFDATSEESEEEYVPSTSKDSSDEADTSEVLEMFNQKKTVPRGCSPLRKGNSTVLRQRRQRSRSASCCKTHFFRGQSLEQNEISHTEDLHGNSTLVCADSTTSDRADELC